MDKLDWTLLRSVASVAENGSLSAAARALRLSQPTLGRHIQTAEAALGQPLFRRRAKGLEPTEFCQTILPAVAQMQGAARQVDLLAAGGSPDPSGRCA